MNIVYYLENFIKTAETYILNKIYELDKRGHNVAVFALKEAEGSVAHEELEELDIPIKCIESPSFSDITDLFSTKVLNPSVIKSLPYPATPQRHAANLIQAKKCIEFIESLEWEPDHIHAHFAINKMFGAHHVAEYYDVPFTLTTHTFGIYGAEKGAYLQDLLQKPDLLITDCYYNKNYIEENFSPGTPIEIIRCANRPEKFSPTEETEPNRVLTTCRLIEKKGLKYALEAIAIATEEIPDVEYNIIGGGPLRSDLESKARDLEIEEKVKFLGNVTDQRLIEELDRAEVFLLPCVIDEEGNRDTCPVAIQEAMAMKTPAVSTTVGGIPELVDHKENDILTEPKEPEEIAEALIELLEDGSKRKKYGKKAREKIKSEFNAKKETGKLETIFQNR